MISYCLKVSLRPNLMTVRDARNILVEKKTIKTKEGKLSKEFDPADLNNLFVDNFVTWYEVHRKVMFGYDYGYLFTMHMDNIMNFPHNVNGKMDVSNGKYSR